jgi:hypothetical protein
MSILDSLKSAKENGTKHILLKDLKAEFERSNKDKKISPEEITVLQKKASLKNVEGSPAQMKFYHLTIDAAIKFVEDRNPKEKEAE